MNPAAALLAYHRALDAHDLATVESMFAKNASYQSSGLGTVHGRANIMASMHTYFENHPDHQAFDDEIKQISEREAVSYWSLVATNKTNGKTAKRRGIERVTFDDEGLIAKIAVEDWEE